MKNKPTKKYFKRAKNVTRRRKNNKKGGKKWQTAIQAAQATLNKTGSLDKAKIALNKQALINARKLFGSI
jgi:hypothetical protein